MKTILVGMALAASLLSASDIELVLAENPIFGLLVAPDLATAQAEAAAMTSLDPVCYAVPEVCAARAAQTVYFAYYSDGSVQMIR